MDDDFTARFSDPDHRFVDAQMDGALYSGIELDGGGHLAERLRRKIAEGGAVEPYVAPPSPRRLVPKSLVLSRLDDAQLERAMGMLNTRQKERWRAPDKPAVFFDDAETLAILRAVGADPDVVMAP